MTAEPVTDTTPRPIGRGRSVLIQRWRALTFLHWLVAPEVVAPLLPAGTMPDTLDAMTYVGLVPFQMYRVGPLSGPGLPYLGTFQETNVRLYSVDAAGRRGVVFLSLDAARLLPVLTARWAVSLPYLWSSMRLSVAGGDGARAVPGEGAVLTYTTRRRWPRAQAVRRDVTPERTRMSPDTPGPAMTSPDMTREGGGSAVTSRVMVRVGRPRDEPDEVERFVTARWGLHVSWHGRTIYLPNEHPRWPLHHAEALQVDERLITAAGLPAPTGPPVSVLYSPGVAVRFGRPVVVR